MGLRFACLALSVSAAVLLPTAGRAQVARYELGKRLQRFEAAWEKADAAGRKRSTAAMQKAVSSFFSFQLTTAAAHLDDAWLIAGSETPAPETTRFLISHRQSVVPFAMDTQVSSIELQWRSYYERPRPVDAAATVRYGLRDSDGGLVLRRECSLEEVLAGVSWELGELGEGDFVLETEVRTDAGWLPLPPMSVSRIRDWESRLAALERAVAEPPAALSSTSRATLKMLLTRLQSQRAGNVLESDYPACRLLQFCEALLAAGADSSQVAAAHASAGLWLTLADKRRETTVRLQAPAKASGPLPVLLLLHGAGGSENMFFETYGAGRAVRLGLDRGWLVVAPRLPLFGGGLDTEHLLQTLEEHFPIDRRNVFLVGHSMGAAETVRQVALHPQLPTAAVALGGGGGASDMQRLIRTPWFVAAGELDFGRRRAESLAQALKRAGAQATYQQYDDVEHMVIVQAALNDVFQFLDDARRPSATTP